MKIKDFRDKMGKADRADLEKIAAELYKAIPKTKKEKDIDSLIDDILQHKDSIQKKGKRVSPTVDFPSLKQDIETFLENVDNDYYLIPNRVVPKNKRSKWRFEVMSFVKQIESVPMDSEYWDDSARLLRLLYRKLSYGCGYYIFRSDDPFNSIGIRQPDFYAKLLNRYFANGYSDERISDMIEDATTVYIDRQSLHIELEMAFAASLPTADIREKAVEIAKGHIDKYESKLKTIGKYSENSYDVKSNIREMCETILILKLLLYEPQEGIDYYHLHDKEYNNEITLYRILDTIKVVRGYGEEWISAYEDGIRRKIEPRDSLKQAAEECRKELENGGVD